MGKYTNDKVFAKRKARLARLNAGTSRRLGSASRKALRWVWENFALILILGIVGSGVAFVFVAALAPKVVFDQYEILDTRHVTTLPFGANAKPWDNFIYTMQCTPSWVDSELFGHEITKREYLSTNTGLLWYTYPETELLADSLQDTFDDMRSQYWSRWRALQVHQVEKTEEGPQTQPTD